MSECEKYSIEDNNWSSVNSMLKGKSNVSACMLGENFIYAFGGNDGNNILNDIEQYDITENKWTAINIYNNFYRQGCYCQQISSTTILLAGGSYNQNK